MDRTPTTRSKSVISEGKDHDLGALASRTAGPRVELDTGSQTFDLQDIGQYTMPLAVVFPAVPQLYSGSWK